MIRSITPRSQDEGICQYARCGKDVPDGITIQLCPKHLRTAYAAFILTSEQVAHQPHPL